MFVRLYVSLKSRGKIYDSDRYVNTNGISDISAKGTMLKVYGSDMNETFKGSKSLYKIDNYKSKAEFEAKSPGIEIYIDEYDFRRLSN